MIAGRKKKRNQKPKFLAMEAHTHAHPCSLGKQLEYRLSCLRPLRTHQCGSKSQFPEDPEAEDICTILKVWR